MGNFLINFINFSGPSGFYWDDAAFKCHDVNECELHGRCQQKCVNYLGGYECQCLDEYKSVGNGKCSPEKESIVAFVYEDRIKYTKFKVLQRKKFIFFQKFTSESLTFFDIIKVRKNMIKFNQNLNFL